MRRALATVAFGVCALALAVPGPAFGWYGEGAQILSAHFERLELADDGTQFAAISADGRYVAFQTSARNFYADDDADPPGHYRTGGIFRMNLETKELELVADGNLRDESNDALTIRGAQNPSISADGRFVAFSTAQALVPGDTNDRIDVYVRDMTIARGATGAFDVVSAPTGSSDPATYGHPAGNPGLDPGAELTRGVALSADGQRVVFRTVDTQPDSASDLPSNLPDRPTADTPEGQVWLRDRVSRTTRLVTRATQGGGPAGGALGGAGISGDGTAVVWTGARAPLQTRFLPGEAADNDFLYYLWQRVADGPAAPTRRITGPSDGDDPDCPPGSSVITDPSATGPCYGPLTGPERTGSDISGQVPGLSSDGWTVAFLTGAGPRPLTSTGVGFDLYVTDMRPGVSRKEGTRELTREGAPGDANFSPLLEGMALSADGRHVAFSTARTAFALPALRLSGPGRQVPGLSVVYVADLATGTVELASRGLEGADTNGDASAGVTISEDGDRVAYTSTASNLFFGDANERPDAFLAIRQPEPQPEPPPPGRDPGGGGTSFEDLGGDEVRLPYTVRTQGRGVVLLTVRVPAAGSLTASARGKVPGLRGRRALARAHTFTPAADRVTLRLRVVRRYRPALRRRGRIPSRVAITFSPSRGGARLARTLRIVFRSKRPQ